MLPETLAMSVSGELLVGRARAQTKDAFRGVNPATGERARRALPEELRRSTASSLPHRLDGAFVSDGGVRR
jgi:hypothetical protein